MKHDLAVADPRGRTEAEWLDVFEYLLNLLSDSTRAKIEIGAYWFDVGSEAASGALGARIRADGALLGVDSDMWEAAFCITGGGEGAYVDVIAFPFLRGAVVTSDGRLDDPRGGYEVEELWLHYSDRKWENRGWRYPDGAGEWDHVRRPGDAFFRGISCAGTKERFSLSEPLMVAVDLLHGREPSLGPHASVSIHRLLRDGQEIIAAPSTTPLVRPGSAHRMALGSTKLPASFRLDSIPIPGGWTPGHYRVEIRLNYARDSFSCDSDISDVSAFEVLAP